MVYFKPNKFNYKILLLVFFFIYHFINNSFLVFNFNPQDYFFKQFSRKIINKIKKLNFDLNYLLKKIYLIQENKF